MSEIKPGQWVVVRRAPLYSGGGDDFGYGLTERVTEKMVFAEIRQPLYRRQHPRQDAIGMPDEATARLFVERATHAKEEAKRREREVWGEFKAFIDSLISETTHA